MKTASRTIEPNTGATQAVGCDNVSAFLSAAGAYPEPTRAVTVVETHISKVFLTDSTVYKLKKPVRFPFLDYSTVETRRIACLDELRLNGRLAPGVYLEVVPIVRRPGGGLQLGGDGDPVDYCVKMVRLPAERMLDHLIRRHRADSGHIERLLDVLIPFYSVARRGPDVNRLATAEAIEANARQNLNLIDSAGHEAVSHAMLQRVRCSQLQFLKSSAALFAERIEAGQVCEGHGDLRPEHVCMLPERPVVFDCVEFSLPFRAADQISELAFLAMECDWLGSPELARSLIEGYCRRTGDDAPDRLVSFYKSYRACVRAKVELLRAAQETSAIAGHSRDRARRYLQLASSYAGEFYRARLFVMMGASGTGKSTIADELAHDLGLAVLRTDTMRHELAGRREPDADYEQGIYSDAFTRLTYQNLLDQAQGLLAQSVSVVLDGTFRDPCWRHEAIELARRCGATIYFVACRCPAPLARSRIAERLARGNTDSDARPQLHDLQRRDTPPVPGGLFPMIELDTTESSRASVDRVLTQLRETSRERDHGGRCTRSKNCSDRNTTALLSTRR
jgi:aminoglycoside phosphotransferase family enzyme/predicted kinase